MQINLRTYCGLSRWCRIAQKILFGVNLPQAGIDKAPEPREIIDFLNLAEDFRFHSVWVLERLLHQEVSVLDSLSLLAFASAVSRQVKLGSAIIITPLRNPVVLAKTAASIDNLSGGRLILGIAVGGAQSEFEASGIPLSERASRFSEVLQIMRRLWTEDRINYKGRFWILKDVSMKPKPIQKPIPVWIGARADIALKRAIRHAEGWIGSGASNFKEFEESCKKVASFLQESGRGSSNFVMAKRLYIHVDPDPDWAEKITRRWMTAFYGGRALDISQTCVYGPIDNCVDTIQQYVDAGAKVLILHPVHDYLNQLRIFASQIIPSF